MAALWLLICSGSNSPALTAKGCARCLPYCGRHTRLRETVVHLGGVEPLPLNRCLIRIAIPSAAWRIRTVFDAAAYVGWAALPAG